MLQSALDRLLPGWQVERATSVSGGCISSAQQVEVRDPSGERKILCVKSNDADFLDNFQAECDGLRRLAAVGVIGVPEPFAVGAAADQSWLIMQWIPSGAQDGSFFARFGRDLAKLHRASLGDQVGLDRDNYLGAALQPNHVGNDWVQFVAEHRLGFQLAWAIDQGLASDRLKSDVQRIIDRLSDLLLGRNDETSLLHGDLWSGNYLADIHGEAVILDPAVYRGCREAEFGMLQLFGGCSDEFYRAYDAEFPLASGWQRRVRVYVLYHLLNHLNLFGVSYGGQCESVAAAILRQ